MAAAGVAEVLAGTRTHALVCGDALEVLPGLPDGCCDHVITDPPYGIGLRNGDVDGHRSARWDSIANDHSPEVGNAVIAWARARGLPLCVFASPWAPWPGRWRNLIVWDKGGAVGGGGDVYKCMKRSWELLQVFNPRPFNGPRVESVWRFPLVPADTADHIAAKPVALMVKILRTFTAPGDVVLDPCMGSGTTGVACLQTGRRFIGIESDPGHFATAQRRIAAIVACPLFDPPPVQANLFDAPAAGQEESEP
jgi:site-specific DNA-methyltransferase (adenine-specific)